MALRSSTAQHPFRAAPRFQRRAAARCGKKGAKKRPPAEAKAGPSVRPPEAGSTLDVVKPYELEPAYKSSDAARRAKSFIEATAEIENEDLVSSNNGARDGVDKSLALLSKTGGDKRKGVVLGEGKDKVILGVPNGHGPQKLRELYAPWDEGGVDDAVERTKKDYVYESTLFNLQVELVKMQEWVRASGAKIVICFEGRDGAGKGSTISRITDVMSPRICRVAALPKPNEREQTQWYFQRYVQHLPAAGEIVLFDRSWYNRAGVEHVMGFCSQAEYIEFMRSCPEFERMLVRSGIILLKYWFSISNDMQEKRFMKRLTHPLKRWKLSTMDPISRSKWHEYSQAKDVMLRYTDTRQCPWTIIPSDHKKSARLNAIADILRRVPYHEVPPEHEMTSEELLSMRAPDDAGVGYMRPPREDQSWVQDIYTPDDLVHSYRDNKAKKKAKKKGKKKKARATKEAVGFEADLMARAKKSQERAAKTASTIGLHGFEAVYSETDAED